MWRSQFSGGRHADDPEHNERVADRGDVRLAKQATSSPQAVAVPAATPPGAAMSAQNVVALPAVPFLIEFRSERLIDLMQALDEAGFKLTNVSGSVHRYRIDDQERPGNDRG